MLDAKESRSQASITVNPPKRLPNPGDCKAEAMSGLLQTFAFVGNQESARSYEKAKAQREYFQVGFSSQIPATQPEAMESISQLQAVGKPALQFIPRH
jgi:hypothetical protein